ncbi:MAG: hypothetical protein A2498_08745 [Lentisphaerae bacterium RIFOXYC12_FULL_60_16]|nr:MAG: hypothetical protein A2498_08745 [Lentisphaerae bacterium RIFOXYC12_FULL_60_16]OGV68495.1 MAG: hypothetical protein A2269_01470 [Lentisphaerae bacterium RIFOXYA12_FULL_60_10]OGV81012.1 MAG: hypothetical protein A2340_07105 [Lentisphaerae bacterium RIFOXYB12_FULL_60_10]
MKPVRFRHRVEYQALRFIESVCRKLPYRQALALAGAIARIMFMLARSRVHVATARILSVLGNTMTPAEARQVAWISLRNMHFNLVDLLRAEPLSDDLLLQRFGTLNVLPEIPRPSTNHTGIILATPHMGSWELAAGLFHHAVMPLFTISAPQHNALVAQYSFTLRLRFGVETLIRGSDMMRTVIRQLRHGKSLAIMPDLRCPEPEIEVPFLGGIANVRRGMALFARLANVPIYPCICIRDGWTRHRIEVHQPILPDKSLDNETDIRRMTAGVLKIMDQAIREHPEQWFWFNKRWVLDPIIQVPHKQQPEKSGTGD